MKAIGEFLELAAGERAPTARELAPLVTPTSLHAHEFALADPNLRSRIRRLGILQRQPHYTSPDHAELLLPILHPDDVALGYEIPEGPDVAIPAAVAYLQRIGGKWLIHSVMGTDF
jgi:hypothetical protein